MLARLAAKPPLRFLFEEGAGLVPVEILLEQGGPWAPNSRCHNPWSKLSSFSPAQVAACVSLSASDVTTERHPAQIVSVGLPFLVVELVSREALRRASPDAVAFANCLPCDGAIGMYVYTRDVPATEACDVQARMFFPGTSGLIEDPATGSATGAAVALFADLSAQGDGELKFLVGQGFDMARPSLLLTRVRKQNGAVISTHVGGSCVPMMEGRFRLVGHA